MYGWRGRIGVLVPGDNSVMEPEFYRMAPEGVSVHSARVRLVTREELPKESIREAISLKDTHVDVLAYMCAASSFMLGPQGNARHCDDLTEASGGLPAFTATTAMVEALHALKARRISVLAPYPPEIAAHLKTYLKATGFEVADFNALGLELKAINNSSPEQVYRAAMQINTDGADVFFIAATNFRALDVIETIERDKGVSVITSNQVAMWMALRMLKVAERPRGFGRLFDA